MAETLNKNVGIVTRLLDGGQRIELRLPKGGRIQCRNQGFEVGQTVCFTLDASKQNVIRVIPKEVADLQVAIAIDPYLQESLMEDPHDDIAENCPSDGYGPESSIDQCCGMGGIQMEGWGNQLLDPADYTDWDWPEDIDDGIAESSGEAAAYAIRVLDGLEDV